MTMAAVFERVSLLSAAAPGSCQSPGGLARLGQTSSNVEAMVSKLEMVPEQRRRSGSLQGLGEPTGAEAGAFVQRSRTSRIPFFAGQQLASGEACPPALKQELASARAIKQLTQRSSLNKRDTSEAESAFGAAASAVNGSGCAEPATAASSGGPQAIRKLLQSASALRRALPVPSGLPEDRVTTGSFTSRGLANRACSSTAMALRMPSASPAAGMAMRATGISHAVAAAADRSHAVTVAGAPPSPSTRPSTSSSHKELEACLLQIIRLFAQLYGPIVLLLDNLHDWDSWSCQLLTRVAESVMLVATKQPSCRGADDMRQVQRRAAETCTANLLKLGSTLPLKLGPFDSEQTRELMQVRGLGEGRGLVRRAVWS